MVAILPFCLLMALPQGSLNWNPKEIRYPSDMARVKFPVYLPSAKSDFKVQRVFLVWIPKLDEFPGRPGRQAIRVTLKDSKGRVLELFETPAIKEVSRTHIGQVIGQGYLDFTLKVGMRITDVQRQSTSVGLVSKDLESRECWDFVNGLELRRAK